jgi:spore maturation protein CgeB
VLQISKLNRSLNSRILFLGAVSPGQTSFMRLRAFERLGHTVHSVDTIRPWTDAGWFPRQVQRRAELGSVVNEINRRIISAARVFGPSVVWAEKQEFVHIETIHELQRLGAKVIHFTPDPYFTLAWKRTTIMDQAMSAFDALVYCKRYEKEQYEALGKPLIYMPLGFCDEVHRPLPSNDARWVCSVGFLGGWEPRRERLLHAIAAAGVDLKIWGAYWDFLRAGRWSLRRHLILHQLAGSDKARFHRNERLACALQGGEVYADDYARALTGSAIGLGLLRKTWPDQHTTRTFEIPACGSLLLADRTEEHQQFFEEGREAEFFASDAELVDKVKFYCSRETARMRIAKEGRRRCVQGGYAYVNRLDEVMKVVGQI